MTLEGSGSFKLASPVLVGIGVMAMISKAELRKGSYLVGGVLNIIRGPLTVFVEETLRL